MTRLNHLLFAGFLLTCVLIFPIHAEELDHTKPATEPAALARGPLEVAWYLPKNQPLRGFFILGSGDGGWSYWETRMAKHLTAHGWAVAGVDFALYATTDYTQAILAGDMARIIAELAKRAKQPADGHLPVIYGGWSMGAEQAVPAAAIQNLRPPGLCGLLLVAPGARGRYGLHTQDKIGFAPTGEGTFALADFAPQMKGLRLAQLHAGLDLLDSIDWYVGQNIDLQLWKYPRAFHDFSNASNGFLAMTDDALAWLLAAPKQTAPDHE